MIVRGVPTRLILACALAVVPRAGLADDGPQNTESALREPEPAAVAALRTLREPAGEGRPAAADVVVAGAADDAVVQAELERMIAAPLSSGAAASELVAAIGRASCPAPALYGVVAKRIAAAAPNELSALLGALASFRTRESAVLIYSYTNGGGAASVRAAAFAALGRLTGRDDLGENAERWADWMLGSQGWDQAKWSEALMNAQAARADRAAARREEAASDLIGALRRLHLATPVDKRAALLAELLRDSVPEVRELGFELVSRELANSGTLSPAVGEAALALLASPQPRVRAAAAVLVRQLAPQGAESAVQAALVKETDPSAASDLLLAAARWPATAVVPPTLAWLERDSPARAAAMEACMRLQSAGRFSNADREAVLTVLRRANPSELPASGCMLLIDIGDDEDRARVAPLMTTGTAAVRAAVADGLAWDPAFTDAVFDAAAKDADLFLPAARAATVHRPTSASFLRVATFPAVTEDTRRAGLMMLAGLLPATELLTAIKSVSGTPAAPLRDSLLDSLISENRVMSEGKAPENLRAIAQGVVLAARAALARGDAGAAYAAIDGAPFLSGVVPVEETAGLRCTALLALGKVEEAARAKAPLAAWMEGLALARGTPNEGRIADVIELQFASEITPAESAVLAAVHERSRKEPAFEIQGPPAPVK
ncbi:MAG: hypothetical protein JSR77_13090 [Planctomycetes bacterium]|nr:hypothetical protein [Planctomycetota bacterium]